MTQEDMIKGRIAEAIVKCMFEDLGFEVIPYGYEHTCPTIAKKDRLIKGDVKNIIRKAPDFIIIDKEGNATFIEVKYRADGVFKKETDYPWDCYIILLSKDYIGVEQYKNLDDETTMTSNDFNPDFKKAGSGNFKSLLDVPLFKGLDKNIILSNRDLLKKYMKD
ncbi:hypothetical protein J4225_00780 [Candidatus Pacearchaeota archaeon]|nr:hypothetical protein [Candidatus Pacearchaeota archaeon]